MKQLFLALGLLCVAQFANASEYKWDASKNAYCKSNEVVAVVCGGEVGPCEPRCYGPSKFLTALNSAFKAQKPVVEYYCPSGEAGTWQATPCKGGSIPGWLNALNEIALRLGAKPVSFDDQVNQYQQAGGN
jgi:hypothetical protein